MKNDKQEMFQIVETHIGQAKLRVEENGRDLLFWGILGTITPLLVYYLLYINPVGKYAYFPWFLFALGGIYQFIYHTTKNKKVKENNLFGEILSVLWIVIGLNIMVASYLFYSYFAALLIPLVVLFLGIGITISGKIIKSTQLLANGIALNICALVAVYLGLSYANQLLFMSFMSLYGIVMPGYLLWRQNKKRNG